MAGIGAPELMIVLVIILVIFGGAKLPKLAKSLGEARREFEAGTAEDAGAVRMDSAVEAGPITRDAAVSREAEVARREADLARREAELRRRDGETR